jgi:hypothetical protein
MADRTRARDQVTVSGFPIQPQSISSIEIEILSESPWATLVPPTTGSLEGVTLSSLEDCTVGTVELNVPSGMALYVSPKPEHPLSSCTAMSSYPRTGLAPSQLANSNRSAQDMTTANLTVGPANYTSLRDCRSGGLADDATFALMGYPNGSSGLNSEPSLLAHVRGFIHASPSLPTPLHTPTATAQRSAGTMLLLSQYARQFWCFNEHSNLTVSPGIMFACGRVEEHVQACTCTHCTRIADLGLITVQPHRLPFLRRHGSYHQS